MPYWSAVGNRELECAPCSKNGKKLFHWSSRRGLGLDKKIRILRGKGWPTLDQMFAAGKNKTRPHPILSLQNFEGIYCDLILCPL